ncbi:MAG TPA: twin transmembrane helix small protein [Steroidobacteraceae bacterium]|nr:twin transmembrane helix small protein [Steroidobacteraceae bacterium]
MPFKLLVVVVLLLILASLGKALYHLSSRKQEDGEKMVKALAWRVGLSVSLFLLLILAYTQGWIHPPTG